MQSTQTRNVSKASLWTGRIISGLLVLFLFFDGITKVFKESHVMAAFAQIGYPTHLAPVIGAILLTGYLGGATEVNLRAGHSLFETLFPVIFGVLVWLSLFLRDDRLRSLIPLSTSE
jgi:hypothetical protein